MLEDNKIFNALAQHIHEAVICLSFDFKVLFLNQIGERIFNCTERTARGMDFSELCAKSGWSNLLEKYIVQIKSKYLPLGPIEIKKDHEKIIWIVTPLIDEKIQNIGFILIGQHRIDIMALQSQLQGTKKTHVIDQALETFHKAVAPTGLEQSALEYGRSVYQYMGNIIASMPGSVYWMNRQGIYLGCNDNMAKLFNLKSRDDIIGKTYEDMYDEKTASFYKKSDEKVMNSGELLLIEEPLYYGEKEKRTYLSNKVPLHDKSGNVIGMLGISIDITAQKETDRLKIENELHKNLATEQEKFMKIANQVAHDIRSPLASLLMIVKSCKEIPEADRIALREAAVGISDIANHLLSRYQKKELDSEIEEKQAILVSVVLLQLLTEKKYQYQNLSVKFDYDFTSNSYFAFIKLPVSAFKRMLSNLINNAVDAFEKKAGKVEVKLDASAEWIKISIQDNGKGMPKEIIDKIMKNIAITAGKESGHGIGLTQVRETLQNNQGDMTIDSKVKQGTKITLTFPRVKTPHWIAEEILLKKDDIIVILDDDISIHGAWNTHFEPILKNASALQLKHFTMGGEALDYINSLPEDQKSKVFLLTDYELLKQELNGLHVVAKSGVQRSVLVTSHYAQQVIRSQAAKTGTKILPKQLASEIPIKMTDSFETEKKDQFLESVDIILVDDDEKFVKNLINFIFAGKTVDEYYDPHHFLKNVSKYKKDTKICLDNNFTTATLRGLDIAKILHEKGFTRIYILSGEVFEKDHVPNYVTVIRKDDIESLGNL